MSTFKNTSAIKFIVALGELLLVNLCFFMVFYLQKDSLSETAYSYFIEKKNFLIFFNLTYLIAFSFIGVVLHRRIVAIEEILDRILKQTLLHYLLLFPLIVLTNKTSEFSFSFIAIISITEFLFCITWRVSFRNLLIYYRTRPQNMHPIIILGTGVIAYEVYKEIILNKTNGYKFVGFFKDDNSQEEILIDQNLIIGSLDDVIPFIKKNTVSEIFCTLSIDGDNNAFSILTFAENNLIRFYFVPDFKKFLTKKVVLQFFNNIPIVGLRSEPLDSFTNAALKRIFDLIFSLTFLITVFPFLYLFIAIGIKLSSKGPVFFKQKRTGKNGESFTCIKFRSMQVNEEANELQATKGDARVTKIGLFLRKTNLDETPQFINVLLGDMTIVGPRPHMVKHTAQYSALIDKYMLRHLAKPGITGWAQVSGHRGETKNVREMERRVIRDVWYLENWTFGLDIRIIFRTIYMMFKGDETAY